MVGLKKFLSPLLLATDLLSLYGSSSLLQ